MSKLFVGAAALIALALPAPVLAQVPDPVRAMIDAAIESGDESTVRTVIELARETNPDAEAELDAVLATYESQLAKADAREAVAEQQALSTGSFFENWSGQGEAGAFRATGNARNTGISAQLGLTRRGENWRHTLRGRADYQSTDGRTTREQYLLGYEPNYKLNDNLFVFAQALYERDRFQGFAARYALTGGLGYRIAESETVDLSVRAGPGWRRTDFVDGRSIDRIVGNAALDFEWQFAENLAFTQNARTYVQQGGSSFVSETGVRAEFAEDFSIRLSYAVEHDTIPPVDAVKTDTLSRVTVVYDF